MENGAASDKQVHGPSRRLRWSRLLGRPGQLALIGLVAAVALGVFLGFFIPAMVQRSLIDSRSSAFQHVVSDLIADGLLDDDTGMPLDLTEFDAAVRLHFIGVNVLRVILWDSDGVAVYSDDPKVISSEYSREEVWRALAGEVVVVPPEEDDQEGLGDLHHPIREFYVPIITGSGIVGVFEVYEDVTSLDSTLTSTRVVVWVSIGLGLGALIAFLLILSRATFAILDRRRRQAELLMTEMARAQESERERLIGALHDEIGQPLYRVLYGLEGSRSQLGDEVAVAEELDRISGLVRWIDAALRSELLMLHQGSIAETDLYTLIERLAQDVRAESPLQIELTLSGHDRLREGQRAGLFRATREAVTNARKHAGASRLAIRVTEGSNRVIVDVEDDGKGYGGEVGLGLDTTRDRLEALGGGLSILEAANGGTLFRAWVPCDDGGDSS